MIIVVLLRVNVYLHSCNENAHLIYNECHGTTITFFCQKVLQAKVFYRQFYPFDVIQRNFCINIAMTACSHPTFQVTIHIAKIKLI